MAGPVAFDHLASHNWQFGMRLDFLHFAENKGSIAYVHGSWERHEWFQVLKDEDKVRTDPKEAWAKTRATRRAQERNRNWNEEKAPMTGRTEKNALTSFRSREAPSNLLWYAFVNND